MWTKDTLYLTEVTLDHWFAEVYAGGAEPDREAIKKEIRRILHQLAYDAFYMALMNSGRLSVVGIAGMGIDLDLIERRP